MSGDVSVRSLGGGIKGADPFWVKACVLVFYQGVQYTKLFTELYFSFIHLLSTYGSV